MFRLFINELYEFDLSPLCSIRHIANKIELRITGSVKANGSETKSCLGRVFNFKLGHFVMCTKAWPIQAGPSLELKTQPRFRPVSLSLSMLPPRAGALTLSITILGIMMLSIIQHSE